MYLAPGRPANYARFVFLDARSHAFFLDWERVADDTVAMLRTEAGRDPHDRKLTDLVGELSTRSDDFRTRWAAHNVRAHQTGTKRYHHPVVGDLTLTYEMFDSPPIPAWISSHSAPSPAPRHTTPSTSSEPGPPPSSTPPINPDVPRRQDDAPARSSERAPRRGRLARASLRAALGRAVWADPLEGV